MRPKVPIDSRFNPGTGSSRIDRDEPIPAGGDIERTFIGPVRRLLDTAGFIKAALLLIDETEDSIEICSAFGPDNPEYGHLEYSPLSLADRTHPLVNAILGREPVFYPDPEVIISQKTDTLLSFFSGCAIYIYPLLFEEKTAALFIAGYHKTDPLTDSDRSVLETAVEFLYLLISNTMLKAELESERKRRQEIESRLPDMDKLLSLSQIVATAAKDLNKSLSCITAYIETLKGKITTTSEATDTLNRMMRESERARKIVSSLSSLSAWDRPQKNSDTADNRSSGKKPVRILVVDDEPAIRESLREVLIRKNFVVETVGTADETFERIAREWFDIILCDVRLPDMQVGNFLKKIQGIRGLLPKTIFMSGDTANEAFNDFIQKNKIFHLIKPFRPGDMFTMIDEVLRLNRDTSNHAVA